MLASTDPRKLSGVKDKSGKKFAPKAPARRPAAATPTQPSAPASANPARASQTPQPETVQQTTKASSPASSQIVKHGTTGPAIEPEIPQDAAGRIQTRLRDDNVAAGDAINLGPAVRNGDTISQDFGTQDQYPADAIAAHTVPFTSEEPRLGQAAQGDSHVREIPTLSGTTQAQVVVSSRSSPLSSVGPLIDKVQPEIRHQDAPPAKRRRLKPDRCTKPSATSTRPRRSTVEVQVTSRSEEPNCSGSLSSGGPRADPSRESLGRTTKVTRRSSVKAKEKQRQRAGDAVVGASTKRDLTRSVRDAQGNMKISKSRQKTNPAHRRRLQNAAAEIVADAVEGTTSRPKGRRGPKAREATPEEAEHETIAPGSVKMADLCKDSGKGKKSDTLRALQERDKEELARKKQKELQQLVEGEERPNSDATEEQENSGAVNGGSGQSGEEVSERQEDVVREVADTYVDEHGQIRINTDSLRIDRHAQAAAAREQDQEEAVVENDLSKPAINSRTYSKREPVNSWPEQLTDDFYEALRTFGTDFGMISRMLRKTRRAVKLKFNREEKADPGRVNQALLGATIAIDLDEYSRRAGEEIKETKEHELKMEEDRKKIEKDAADELQAKEEHDRLREDQADKEQAAVPDDSSGKENRECGRKRKKGRKDAEKRKRRKETEAVVGEPSGNT
ncbi:MAG: hypothetical protein L6R35_001154 [Caloplaca aegaea]|nr:MAG: hypothetical protein L6R35_001154 [Caloplaca aegaea]